MGQQEKPILFPPLPESHFFSQTLRSHRPMMTPLRAIIFFYACAIVLTAVAVSVLTCGPRSVRVRYDDTCPMNYTAHEMQHSADANNSCTVTLSVEKRMSGNLKLSYELTGFHQNHRRFDISKSEEQLAGDYVSFSGLSNCKPYRSVGDVEDAPALIPSGLFARMVFNDTFAWTDSELAGAFNETGIASEAERKHLFAAPSNKYINASHWLEDEYGFVGGQTNEHFIVWMRTGALSTLRKLYARCDGCTVEPGNYSIAVASNYPAEALGMQKWIVLHEDGTLESSFNFLSIAYLIGAALCLVYALTLSVSEIVAPRTLGRKLRHTESVN